MVATSEPITRHELDAKLGKLASKDDLQRTNQDITEIKTDLKWMKWVLGIAIPVMVATVSAAEIITAIKS